MTIVYLSDDIATITFFPTVNLPIKSMNDKVSERIRKGGRD